MEPSRECLPLRHLKNLIDSRGGQRSGPQSQQRGARLTLLSQLIESGCFAFRYMPYSERNRNAKQPNPVYTVEEEEEEEEEEELIKITRPGGAARLPLDEGD